MIAGHGGFHAFGGIAFGEESVTSAGVNGRVRSR